MVLSVVLDRYPNLTLIQTHLGGVLPMMTERIERGYNIYPEIVEKRQRSPMEYFQDMYFDTVLFEPEVAMMVLNFCGEDRMMLGSDHPHQVGDLQKCSIIIDGHPVEQEVKNKIFARNAIELLGLKVGA